MNEKNSETLLYILTFFSMILLVTCFATHLFTGRTDFIEMDSLAGSTLIGAILFLYLCWITYDFKISKNIFLRESISQNLRHNPAVLAMYSYWTVFILVPALFNLFN